MIPLLMAAAAPLVKDLIAAGFSAIAGAVTTKGKEWVEDKTGLKLDEIKGANSDKLLEFKQAEMIHEEILLAAAVKRDEIMAHLEEHASTQVTERWKADMGSDSWLSKNIRPMTLIFFLALLLLILISDSVGKTFQSNVLNVFEGAFQIILAAYFAGRTIEKAVSLWKNGKSRGNGK